MNYTLCKLQRKPGASYYICNLTSHKRASAFMIDSQIDYKNA
jgi:hypothetical protein